LERLIVFRVVSHVFDLPQSVPPEEATSEAD
jgi:hypothetical protein